MPRLLKTVFTVAHIIQRKPRTSFSSEVGFSFYDIHRPAFAHIPLDKHGQLGIWDARAPPDEIGGEDGDVPSIGNREGGKYWRLQPHWPATAKSSISCIKFDPVNSNSVCSRLTSYFRIAERNSFSGHHKFI